MSREILLLVDALAHEKNVAKDVIFIALELALASASKKRFSEEADVRVAIDRDNGEYQSFRRWQVVDDEALENAAAQIALSDPRAEGLAEGDYIEEPLESIEFGRIGAQAAKQVIQQKVRCARPSVSRFSKIFWRARNIWSPALSSAWKKAMPSSKSAGWNRYCLATR